MSLKVVKLSKRYNDKWVLRDVSFEVADGEIYGLFGPLGAGKTTLLDAMQGNTSTNGGSVFYRDTDVTTLGRAARRFRSPEAVHATILERFLKSDNSFSKAERDLAAISSAIDSAENVLFLDESFCGMNFREFESITAKLRETVRERGLSVIFASNNFEQIMIASDRAAVIINGGIEQIGAPKDIYESPESRVVAEVTGRNNLFAARRLTSSKADTPEFHTIDGGHRLFTQRVERAGLGALNQNVTLAIRPEQISISFGASFPEDNLLKAIVTRVQFLGATTLIDLDAGGLNLQALVLRLVGLNVGDECMVGLPPDRIQIFKD
jgi:ABC-type Fe3+/spermidine/putrescine transport system ATPase subunit